MLGGTQQFWHLPPMAIETTSKIRVRYAETDQMGVVYHSNYLIWCEIGRTDYIRSAGKSYADLERDGVRLAVSEATIRYHGGARYDDNVNVYTTLTALGSRGMTFSYRVVRVEPDGKEVLLVRATTSLVSTNTEGKPQSLPREVREWLQMAAGEAGPGLDPMQSSGTSSRTDS